MPSFVSFRSWWRNEGVILALAAGMALVVVTVAPDMGRLTPLVRGAQGTYLLAETTYLQRGSRVSTTLRALKTFAFG